MIKQLDRVPTIPARISRGLKKFTPFKGGEWAFTDVSIKEFKTLIKYQLKMIQNNKCAYCGLTLGETSRYEIEHIAPKGGAVRPKYVQYTFTAMNLVLACNLCNCPEKKGTYDTVVEGSINKDYRAIQFKIVHPYIDDHLLHYAWPTGVDGVLIQGISVKGIESIRLFKLSSSEHTEARVKLKLFEFMKNSSEGQELIAKVLAYNPF
jgi:uncharacterized protein (TIGR02646 family)